MNPKKLMVLQADTSRYLISILPVSTLVCKYWNYVLPMSLLIKSTIGPPINAPIIMKAYSIENPNERTGPFFVSFFTPRIKHGKIMLIPKGEIVHIIR